MNKRTAAVLVTLLLLTLASLWGLPLMTRHMEKQRQNTPVYVTVMPEMADEEL